MKKIMLFSVLGIALDQATKYIISIVLELGESISIIPNFFHFTYVRNFGAAFSILNGNRLFFIIIGLFALVAIYYLFLKNKKLNTLEIGTYSLLISGILGNLLDRIIRGYVVDFFDFTIFGYHFPIFNIADICIVLAVAFILYTIIKEEKHGNHSN